MVVQIVARYRNPAGTSFAGTCLRTAQGASPSLFVARRRTASASISVAHRFMTAEGWTSRADLAH